MLYQAITTKYIGPSNYRGSRVKAIAEAGSVTLHWDDALNSTDNHNAAAKALADKFKWKGAWFGGGLVGGRGNVYVQISPNNLSESISSAAEFVTNGE